MREAQAHSGKDSAWIHAPACAGEIWRWVVFSPASNDGIAEDFAAALPNFLAFSVAPRPSIRRSTFSSSSGLISAIGFCQYTEKHLY
jgi:hypothetical protein